MEQFFLLNALHHVQDVAAFFGEARRCLRNGGVVAMVEPANTIFGRFVYTHFHHEPFLPEARTWRLLEGGPLSMANGALPWMLFCRDRELFAALFPQFEVRQVQYCYPLIYLLSGGFSYPQFVPGRLDPLVSAVERLLRRVNRYVGLFMRASLSMKCP